MGQLQSKAHHMQVALNTHAIAVACINDDLLRPSILQRRIIAQSSASASATKQPPLLQHCSQSKTDHKASGNAVRAPSTIDVPEIHNWTDIIPPPESDSSQGGAASRHSTSSKPSERTANRNNPQSISENACPNFRMLPRGNSDHLPYDVFTFRTILAILSGALLMANIPAIRIHDRLYHIPLQLDLELRGVHLVEHDALVHTGSSRIPPFPLSVRDIPRYVLLRTRNGLAGTPAHSIMNDIISDCVSDRGS